MTTLAATTPSKSLGQVFTPPAVADWMARWACADGPRRICDPALGDGVFIESLQRCRADARRTRQIDAFEIDPLMIAAYRRRQCPQRVNILRRDFVTATATGPWDAVVANPPYVRHHDYAYPPGVLAAFDRQCRRHVSRLTNLYGLFLLKIWRSLAPGGRAAVITPAEWLNADFGRALKAYFIEENAIDGIVHFGHGARVFDGALTTAAITLLRRGRSPDDPIRLGAVEDVHSLESMRLDRLPTIRVSRLDPNSKWTTICLTPDSPRSAAGPTLGNIARCTRGIATGANDYFTFRESDRLKWRLDHRDLRLCITKAPHVPGDRIVRADIRRMIESDQRVYLLAPRPRLTDAVRRYLDEGQRRGIPQRYLPAHRPVWFQPEARGPAPILVSVFAREDFRFVRNRASVLNLTAFHGIYPKAPFAKRRGFIDRLWKYLNSDDARNAIVAHQRIYAEGLRKLEPRDVEAIPIPGALLNDT